MHRPRRALRRGPTPARCTSPARRTRRGGCGCWRTLGVMGQNPPPWRRRHAWFDRRPSRRDSRLPRNSRGRGAVLASASLSAAPSASAAGRTRAANRRTPCSIASCVSTSRRSSRPCATSAANPYRAMWRRSFASRCVAGSWRTDFCASCAQHAAQQTRPRLVAGRRLRGGHVGSAYSARRAAHIAARGVEYG